MVASGRRMQVMAWDLATVPKERLAEYCWRRRIRRLALFGSALRDDFSPGSDLDLLVEFEPGVRVGLSFFTMQDELSGLLGRQVDLNTRGFLGSHIHEKILADAHELYAAA